MRGPLLVLFTTLLILSGIVGTALYRSSPGPETIKNFRLGNCHHLADLSTLPPFDTPLTYADISGLPCPGPAALPSHGRGQVLLFWIDGTDLPENIVVGSPWRFALRTERYDAVAITATYGDGSTQHRSARRGSDLRSSLGLRNDLVFSFDARDTQPTALIIRLDNTAIPRLVESARVMTPKWWRFESYVGFLLAGLLSGLLIALIAYNFSLYIMLQLPFLLFYCLWGLGSLIYLLGYTQLIAQVFPELAGAGTKQLNFVAFGIMGIGSLRFASAFVEDGFLSSKSLFLIRVLARVIFVMCVVAALGWIPFGDQIDRLMYALSGVCLLLALSRIILAAFQGSRAAQYYVIGWLLMLVGVFIRILTGVGLMPRTDALDLVFFAGMGAEMLFIALVIADRIRGLRDELEQNRRQRDRYQRLANTDALTGVANRRYFDAEIERLALAACGEKPLGVLMIDIDYFKALNDQFGHDCGDKALRQVASLCEAECRAEDVFARTGGEEFSVLVPGAGAAACRALAERLRAAASRVSLADIVGTADGHDLVEGEKSETESAAHLTVSIGVAVAPDHGSTPQQLMRLADKALYTAKAAGRNRVCVSGDSSVTAPDHASASRTA